jgi:hypothetical protein
VTTRVSRASSVARNTPHADARCIPRDDRVRRCAQVGFLLVCGVSSCACGANSAPFGIYDHRVTAQSRGRRAIVDYVAHIAHRYNHVTWALEEARRRPVAHGVGRCSWLRVA